jgi:YVTN family beta-propeller protein
MRSRLQLRTATACIGIVATAASLLAMAPARAHGTGPAQAGSPHVITTIPVNREPVNIAVNPATDMIYVTEPAQLQVIDGKTGTVAATLHMPNQVFDVAVDPATDMIYATDSSQRSVLAIDGKTNTVAAQIRIGGFGFWIAVDPRTDRIYTENATSPGVEHVAVIDGRTNSLITRIPTHAIFEQGIAVNPVTNTIYAAAGSPDSLLVINGQTNKVTATVDTSPFYVATDPVTNTIYATELGENSGLVDVINGQTNTLSTVISGGSPEGIATDPRTDFVYTADFWGGNVRVINGQTSKVTAKVGVGHHPQGVAADPQTNRIYVANTGSRSVSVLAGAG